MAARSDPGHATDDGAGADGSDRCSGDTEAPGGHQKWLREVVDMLAEGVVVMDRSGHVIDANPAAHRILRAEPGELIERPRPMDRWRVMDTEGRLVAQAEWPAYVSSRRPLGVVLGVEALDGSLVWIELNTRPVRDDPDGSVSMVVASFRDLTDERDAQQELEFQNRLLDAAGNAIVATAVSGEIIFWNRAAEELYGWLVEEALGQQVVELLADEDLERRMGEIAAALEDQGRWFGEMWVKDRHGYRFPVLVANTALVDDTGRLTAIISVVTDISERVQAEKDVTEANRRLAEARRIAERKDFERVSAERANQAKSELLARMSNELRTPLDAVLGFAQVLQGRELPAEDRESVGHILGAGMHLLDLVDEVRDIARIEQNQLSLSIEPVLVRDIVQTAIELIGPTAAEHQVTVLGPEGVNDSLRVLADRQRSVQVLLNLLSNAVEYGRAGGLAQVLVVPAGIAGVRVSVMDTGVGIAADHLDKLWQPFERLDANRSGTEGTGVGLVLSHRLVEQMNGRVGVSSTVDQGSTFWFELPRAVDAAPLVDLTAVAGAYDLVDEQTITVLCIEENKTIQHLLERALGLRPQVRQIHAVDRAQGVALAREHHPELVLIDRHLPAADAGDVVDELRRDALTADVAIAVVGCDEDDPDAERLSAAGVETYLSPPLEIERLLGLIDALLLTRS